MSSGTAMPPTTLPTDPKELWNRVLRACARLQSAIPGTTVVGGTATALWARHRVSYDADHVLVDLRDRYVDVLNALESLPDWETARHRPPVLILGSLEGVPTGLRQLIRATPLETTELTYDDVRIRVPTLAEMLRIKGYLVLERNHVRDYVDFLALAMLMNDHDLTQALTPFDALYPLAAEPLQQSGRSALHELGIALGAVHPEDLSEIQWQHFDVLSPAGAPWDLPTIQTSGLGASVRVLRIHDDLLDSGHGDTESASNYPMV